MIELKECICCGQFAPEGDCKTELTKRLGSVLGASAGDPNYDGALRRLLGMEEIKFVIAHEGRKAGQAKIRRELRNRGLTARKIKLIYEEVNRERASTGMQLRIVGRPRWDK